MAYGAECCTKNGKCKQGKEMSMVKASNKIVKMVKKSKKG